MATRRRYGGTAHRTDFEEPALDPALLRKRPHPPDPPSPTELATYARRLRDLVAGATDADADKLLEHWVALFVATWDDHRASIGPRAPKATAYFAHRDHPDRAIVITETVSS